MTHHQPPLLADESEADAAQALLRLRGVLGLVEHMAGEGKPSQAPGGIDHWRLDEGAELALAYANASSVARRRFDALAGEAAEFVAVGLDALRRHKKRTGRECAAGARRLAIDIRQSIGAMTRMIEVR